MTKNCKRDCPVYFRSAKKQAFATGDNIATPVSHPAGKHGIFAEHIFYGDSSVCNYMSSFSNVCLLHGKILQDCMQTVLFVKTRTGT